MAFYQIDWEPIGRRGPCSAGQTLLDCARRLGVDLASLCGGRGTCGRCRVQVLAGRLSEPTATEHRLLSSQELADGYRLACQALPMGDCRLRVPPSSLTTPQRTQVEGLEVSVPPEPAVATCRARLSPPSLSDLQADADRLLAALGPAPASPTIDLQVLRGLSPQLRACGWQVAAYLRGNEVVAVGPAAGRALGLAVDVGTTKIAAYLVDLESGQTLAAQGAMNPQIAYGEDVVSRLALARESPAEASRLQALVAEALNQLASELTASVGAGPETIVDAVAVGNTAMHHLLLHLPVEQLALAPYVPAVSEALDVKAREVGLRLAPGAYLHLLPNVAGFVGADHVATLLATGAAEAEGVVLIIDIGTNTEICLVCDGRLTSASCASGPAFEGAHIKHGMRASSGAIERLRLTGDQLEYQTIGGSEPAGICGSGILDILAQLYLAGVLDRRGKLGDHPLIRTCEGEREFVVVPEAGGRPAITFTQRDVRQLQMAKAAIRAGIQLLVRASGHAEADIDRIIIAGAFGSYIDVASAVTIGLLPPLPLNRFRQVGNAAGTGARLALISRQQRAAAQTLARRVGYLELAADPDFARTFMQANFIG